MGEVLVPIITTISDTDGAWELTSMLQWDAPSQGSVFPTLLQLGVRRSADGTVAAQKWFPIQMRSTMQILAQPPVPQEAPKAEKKLQAVPSAAAPAE